MHCEIVSIAPRTIHLQGSRNRSSWSYRVVGYCNRPEATCHYPRVTMIQPGWRLPSSRNILSMATQRLQDSSSGTLTACGTYPQAVSAPDLKVAIAPNARLQVDQYRSETCAKRGWATLPVTLRAVLRSQRRRLEPGTRDTLWRNAQARGALRDRLCVRQRQLTPAQRPRAARADRRCGTSG